MAAAFMDEGLENGKCLIKPRFYNAWRKLAVYDTDMPKTTISEIQKQKWRH
jgi:hypothetical protein